MSDNSDKHKTAPEHHFPVHKLYKEGETPTAEYRADSITATDCGLHTSGSGSAAGQNAGPSVIGGLEQGLRSPTATPNPDHALDSTSTHHTDNELSSEIRRMKAKDAINPEKLRAAAERHHVHQHPGMSGSA